MNTINYKQPIDIYKALEERVIGQSNAKKKLALALISRNRQESIEDKEMRDNIKRKNVMLIGKTGTGKTELSKSIASILKAPFVKADATKFTEIGYVGSDAETMIKDLVENSIMLQRKIEASDPELMNSAEGKVIEKIIQIIASKDAIQLTPAVKEDMISRFKNGEFDNTIIEVSLKIKKKDSGGSQIDLPGAQGIISMLPMDIFGGSDKKDSSKKLKKIPAKDAFKALLEEEVEALRDDDLLVQKAIKRAEEAGIVFIDEIDKLISSHKGSSRGDVSREGVQRDLLPIVDGTKVKTKHGDIDTKNILFICAGAFESAKPIDLLPELQGRFPINAKLSSLTVKELTEILSKPKFSLIKQHIALMETEGGKVEITDDAIRRIAEISNDLNLTFNNIGARRLQGVTDCVFEELSFNGFKGKKTFKIDTAYVNKVTKKMFDEDVHREDLYIL